MYGTLMESTPKQMASPAARQPRKIPYKAINLSSFATIRTTHSIVGALPWRVRKSSKEVQDDVLPKRPGNPVKHEQEEYRNKVLVGPVQWDFWRRRSVIITHTDDLPYPSSEKRDTYHSQSDQSASPTLPYFGISIILRDDISFGLHVLWSRISCKHHPAGICSTTAMNDSSDLVRRLLWKALTEPPYTRKHSAGRKPGICSPVNVLILQWESSQIYHDEQPPVTEGLECGFHFFH